MPNFTITVDGVETTVCGADSIEHAYALHAEAMDPPLSAQDVKMEAQRRIIALTGAGDLQSCLIKQLNANMRANEMNDKRVSGDTLTPEEEAEATALRGLADGIKAIRAASNVIEAMSPIPDDFADDSYWE
jgi:hypothetical protein